MYIFKCRLILLYLQLFLHNCVTESSRWACDDLFADSVYDAKLEAINFHYLLATLASQCKWSVIDTDWDRIFSRTVPLNAQIHVSVLSHSIILLFKTVCVCVCIISSASVCWIQISVRKRCVCLKRRVCNGGVETLGRGSFTQTSSLSFHQLPQNEVLIQFSSISVSLSRSLSVSFSHTHTAKKKKTFKMGHVLFSGQRIIVSFEELNLFQ